MKAWLPRSARIGGLLLALSLTSCGLAESIAEGFVDDRDVTIPTGEGLFGTAIRASDGTDVGVEWNVLRPGDRATDDQALAVFAFSIDPSLPRCQARFVTFSSRTAHAQRHAGHQREPGPVTLD